VSRFIAIDVDAAGLFVVAGFAKGNSVRVEQAVPVLDDPRPLTPDSAPELGRRLKEALAAARVAPAAALVCVGRDRVVFKDIRHPKTAPAEEPAVVRFQAQRDLAEPPDTLHLDYAPLPSLPGADDKRATAVFVKKDLFNAARAMCEAAGLKMAGFTPRPYASAAAVRRAVAAGTATPPETPTAPIGVLSLWDGGGEFVVYHGEHLIFTRSVSGMALQSETALVGEAKRSLAAYSSQYPRDRLDAVYLSEGHSGGGSWAARLEQSLPLPVHPFDPLVGSPAADALPTHLRGRFTAAVGLLAARGHGPLPINFVTPRQPRAEPSKARNWAMLGVLGVLVLAGGVAAGLYLLHDRLDKKLTAAQQKKKRAEEDMKDAQKVANKVKAIEQFRERDVNWLDLFYDFTVASPDVNKVRVREFEGKFKPAKAEAKAPANTPLKPGVKAAAAPPPATKAAEPVADLKVDLVWASDAEDGLVERLVAGMFAQDKQHFASWTAARPTTSSGKRQAVVQVDLLPRKPSEYKWVLKAEFPKVVVPPPAEEPNIPFDVLPFNEGDLP
jgi:Tfp pilus assembly PilM family ATPase